MKTHDDSSKLSPADGEFIFSSFLVENMEKLRAAAAGLPSGAFGSIGGGRTGYLLLNNLHCKARAVVSKFLSEIRGFT
jgi:hypothetical protein